MKTKKEITDNWLPRYTGVATQEISKYILLTNFQDYLDQFCHIGKTTVADRKVAMPSATSNGITMINFGMGSANAATVMDLLAAAGPKAVLFLGKCGGLKKKNELGDLILPIAAIRGDAVPPGEASDTILLKSNYGVDGNSLASFKNNPGWKTVIVQLFAQSKGSQYIKLGEWEVSKTIDFKEPEDVGIKKTEETPPVKK